MGGFMSNLVIYFSRSGENYFGGNLKNIEKGNTEVIAEYIQNFCDAELFKVEALNDYPYDYMECIDIAKKEMENDERPQIKESLSDISAYDTIFIGFPNWWGTLPMPMFTQLEKLNWEGKTIRVFTTHEGSGLGNVVLDVKRICNNAIVLDNSLAISGSEVNTAKSKVEDWINN